MSEPFWLVLAFFAALAAAAALCRGVIVLGVMDAPTEARKIQTAPVPTSGGLGVALAAIAVLAGIAAAAGWSIERGVPVVAGAGAAALALGFVDDRVTLRAWIKLVGLLAICAVMVGLDVRAELLAPWPDALWQLALPGAVAGSLLWLIVVANAVNFMDGANGLSMGMAAIAALGLGVCAAMIGDWPLALLVVAMAGGLAGFLVWNIPGKLFAGDAGALFAGVILGGVSLELVKQKPDWVLIPATLMLPFLTDVLLTLIWRARHRKPLFAAHRDHAYQIAMKAGLRHWQVALIHAVWSANALALALVAAVVGGWTPLAAFLTLLAASIWVHLRVRKSGVRAGLVGANVP
jgi:UDP-GlcNAc:undecaprenyl-phosphate/decaprenyl-phosphate GlcNAc-1-phosphate transferase